MSFQKEVFARYGDSPSVDAFGRVRSSQPVSIFDYKSIFGLNTEIWESETVGVGSSVTHQPNEASILLTAGDGIASALMQTYRYFPYVPGRSFLVIMTGVLGNGVAGTIRRIGLFDDNNGLFFELNGTTFNVVRRTKTSGAVVNNSVPQTSWNLDTLDGNGKSKITLDISKAHIFIIDFQWLGVGRVRFGFNIDGQVIYCHEMVHANTLDVVYMATPTLPLRYEIAKTSGLATTLKAICCSLSSEAGYLLPGMVFSASNGATLRSGITARTPIIAVRLKNTFNTKENRHTAYFVDAGAFISGSNALVEIEHVHGYSSVTGNWNSVSDDSAVEYSSDISAIANGASHALSAAYVAAGAGQGRAPPPATIGPLPRDFINHHSFISQNKASNKSQMMVVYVTPLSGTISAAGSLSWAEFE